MLPRSYIFRASLRLFGLLSREGDSLYNTHSAAEAVLGWKQTNLGILGLPIYLSKFAKKESGSHRHMMMVLAYLNTLNSGYITFGPSVFTSDGSKLRDSYHSLFEHLDQLAAKANGEPIKPFDEAYPEHDRLRSPSYVGMGEFKHRNAFLSVHFHHKIPLITESGSPTASSASSCCK